MRKFYLLLLSLLIYSIIYSQTFQKLYGGYDVDNAVDMIKTFDGNYLMLGQTASFGAGDYDLILTKTDKAGNVLWAKTFGTNLSERAGSLIETNDSAYLILGWQSNSVIRRSIPFLVKVDHNGNLIWAKELNFVNINYGAIAYSLIQTTSNDFLITGYENNGGTMPMAIMLSSDGNLLWCHSYNFNDNQTQGYCSIQTKDKGWIMSGFSFTTEKGFLIKFDSSNHIIWAKGLFKNGDSYPLQSNLMGEHNSQVIVCFAANYFTSTGYDIGMARISDDGVLNGIDIYYGGYSDVPSSIALTKDSGFVLTGQTGSIGFGSGDVFLMKLDSARNINWVNFCGSLYQGFAAQSAFDNGYIFCGTTANPCGLSTQDMAILKTDSSGLNDCIGRYGSFYHLIAADTLVNLGVAQNNENVIDSPETIISTDVQPITSFLCVPLEIKKALIYPNPFVYGSTLEIEFDNQDRNCPSFIGSRHLTFVLYDLLGRVMTNQPINTEVNNLTNRIEIPITRGYLANSLYIWRLIDESGVVIGSGKLIIQ